MSVPETGAKLCLVDLAKRLEDLRLLCELERRTLARQRLCVRDVISLNALRDAYPGSAVRIRDELLMGEEDEDRLLAFTCEREDLDHPDWLRREVEMETPRSVSAARSPPNRESDCPRRPDGTDADDPSL